MSFIKPDNLNIFQKLGYIRVLVFRIEKRKVDVCHSLQMKKIGVPPYIQKLLKIEKKTFLEANEKLGTSPLKKN